MIYSKAQIRKEIGSRLYNQDKEEKRVKSQIIKDKLFSSDILKKAHVVMFYVSKEEEVDTRRMIKDALETGKRVVVPYSLSETNEIIAAEIEGLKDLEIGVYGIYQPRKKQLKRVPLSEINLAIVPGVAFDKQNHRLGRGKGYYDRFLKNLSSRTITIGICFDFQLVDNLPKETHDFPVSRVITN